MLLSKRLEWLEIAVSRTIWIFMQKITGNSRFDLDQIFKECQLEATRLLQKYLVDRKIDPSTEHPSLLVEKEINELLNNRH
jgi:hypothetical protein